MGNAPTIRPAEARADRFIKKNCICATCVHGIDRNLFGSVFCDQPGMAGGWNPAHSCCEEHAFRNPFLEKKLTGLLDAWHAEAEAAGEFSPPLITEPPK